VVAVIPISATEGTNLDAVVDEIRAHLEAGLLYDDEYLTDRPERFFAAELVREAVMKHTRDEVPYGVAILVDEYSTQDQLVRIHATVVVEKDAHKKIVIGKGGSRLKTIGTEARHAIEGLLGKKVFLRLWVKVIKGWTNIPHHVRDLATGRDS
jgi:GTP-binding protein Era